MGMREIGEGLGVEVITTLKHSTDAVVGRNVGFPVKMV